MARPKKEAKTEVTPGATVVNSIKIEGNTAYTPFGPAKILKQEGDVFICEYADKSTQKVKMSNVTLAK